MNDRTVKIGDYTSADLDLIFHTLVIGSPDVKTNEIDIPDSDSVLDLTEVFGGIYYKRRKITMSFWINPVAFTPNDTPLTIYSKVLDKWHGQKLNITFSSDEFNHYIGRISVGDLQQNGNFWGFTVIADAEPYKYDYKGNKITL